MSVVWGSSKKLNRSTYLHTVSHCEALGYQFKSGYDKTYYEIWHPTSGKKVDCSLDLIEKYFGTGKLCNVFFYSSYPYPYREIWRLGFEPRIRNNIYGEFITDVYLGEYSLEKELFEL